MLKDEIITLLSDLATQERLGIYLVGGYVRDEILGIENKDIDVTVEGDARRVAEKLSKRLGVRIKKTSQFGTFILFMSSYRIDIATARSERYSSPGALPEVLPGNILDDLSRRDFTINSMAKPVNYATIIDPFSGLVDLKKGSISILHGKSFEEDPTRIFRAIRFAQRMNFRIEEITTALLNEAIDKGFLTKVSPARIRNEIALCLEERTKHDIFEKIANLGIFGQLGLNYPGKIFFEELEDFAMRFEVELESLYFVSLSDAGSNKTLLTKKESKYLNSVKTLEKRIPILKKSKELGEIYTILEGFPRGSLIYIGVKGSVREAVSLYLEEIEPVKLEITGDDIKKIGIIDGKTIGMTLRAVKKKKLDGSLNNREDEINYLMNFILPKIKTNKNIPE